MVVVTGVGQGEYLGPKAFEISPLTLMKNIQYNA